MTPDTGPTEAQQAFTLATLRAIDEQLPNGVGVTYLCVNGSNGAPGNIVWHDPVLLGDVGINWKVTDHTLVMRAHSHDNALVAHPKVHNTLTLSPHDVAARIYN